MNKKSVILSKALNSFVGLLLIFQSFAPGLLYAQETSAPSPQSSPSETLEPSPSIEPTTIPESSPSPSVLPGSSPEVTPSSGPSSEPKPTDQTENNSSPEPTVGQPNAPPDENPLPSQTPEPSPSVTVEQTAQGNLSATILENTDAESLELDLSTQSDVSSASLSTDKADYAPTDTAVITGAQFPKNENLKLIITADNYRFEAVITTDENGTFVYFYQLDGIYRPLYNIEAQDPSGQVLATTTFTDSNAPLGKDFDQCANQNTTLGECNWIGSALQSNNSEYNEGMSVPQRILFTNIPAISGNVHTLTFSHQSTKGGKHAYDFLTAYNQGNNPAITLNPCDDLGGNAGACNTLRGGANNVPVDVPDDPFVSKDGSTQSRINAYEALYGNRQVKIYANSVISAASFSSISHDVANGVDTGDSDVLYTLTWTSSSSNILIELAGHISLGIDQTVSAVGWGSGLGAGSVSGGPYHFKLGQLDGSAIGAQDNQIQAGAVILPGTIIIKKDTDPDDPTDFSFSTSGNGLSSFSLDDDSDSTLSNTKTFTGLAGGSFSVTENSSAEFTLINLSCDPSGNTTINGSTANINIAAGETVTCTFTNTRNGGSVKVHKFIDTNGDGTFDLISDSNANILGFRWGLDGASPTTDFGTEVTGFNAGSHSVNENSLTDYRFVSWFINGGQSSCTNPDGTSLPASITVNSNLRTEITLCNARKVGTITVNKVLDPVNDPGLFNLQIDGSTAGTGANVGNGGTTGQITVTTGSHNAGETAGSSTSLSDYSTSISCTNGQSGQGTTLSVSVSEGDNITCTITNTRNTGTLRVLKNVDLNGDGDYIDVNETGATDWKWQANAGADHNTGDPTITVNTGNYALTETSKTDFHQVSLSCTGGTLTGNSVSVTSGANVICTFTNAHDTGTIELKKAWLGTGGQTTLNIGTTVGGSEVNSQLTGVGGTSPLTTGQNTVNTGTYNVSESGGLIDYSSVLSCFNDANNNGVNDNESAVAPDGSNNVSVTTGQHVICTFTNTRNIGTIELKKAWSGTAGQTTLQIGTTAGGNDVINTLTGASGGAPLTTGVQTVDTGIYYVSETGGLTNYGSSLSCTDDGSPVTPGTNNSLTVAKNHTVVCTFTNTHKQGKIELQKDFVGTTENVTIKIGTNQGGSQVDSDILSADGTDGEHSVDTGNYFVSETLTAPVNYTTGLVCYNDLDNSNTVSGGDTARAVNTGTGEVSVGEGDDILCVFTNTRNTGILQVFKNVDLNGDEDYTDQGESGVTDWAWDIAGGDQDIATGQSKTLNTGSYTISEDPKTNYHMVDWSCSDETSGTTNSILANVTKDTTLTCTFYNARNTGTIKVIKDVVPNDNGTTGWDFAITDPTTNSASDLQDGEESSTFTSVTGSYTVTESAHSGTNANNYNTTYSCSDNTGVLVNGSSLTTSSFNLLSNKNVVCTFTNTIKNGTIIIQKDMVGGTDSFDFTGEKPGTISTSGGQLSKSVLPGTYTATESAKTGWDLTGLTCDDSDSTGDITSRTATFHVNPNETVKCNFTNTKRGQVVIVKDAITNNAQDFTFQNNFGNGYSGSFQLDDDSGAAGANSTFSNSVSFALPPATYSVSEDSTAGWKLSDITCVDPTLNSSGNLPASPSASINVAAGETVTCTFTNRKLGSIVLNKNTIGGNGTFDFVMTGQSLPASTQLITATGSATQTFEGIDPENTYSINETVPTGWNLTGTSCVNENGVSKNNNSFTINNGGTVTCTFTNTKRGHIIVDKITDPSVDLQSFDFEASGSGYLDFSLIDTDTPNDQELIPGTYSVSETVPNGWDQTGATCDNQQTPGNITLGAGETVNCTFTNTKRGYLTVQKTTIPGGELDFFTINATGTGTITGQTETSISDNQDSILTVTPGTYYVTETLPTTGWEETNNGCQGVIVGAGEDETCTITNTKLGTIIVEKQTDPDEAEGDFTFSGDFLGTVSDNGQIIVEDLLPGTYTMTEDDPTPGFDLTDISCNDGQSDSISAGDVSSRTAAFRLDPGETITCTFTNTQRGTISGTKYEVNSDGSIVGVLSGWIIRLFSGEGTGGEEIDQTVTDGFGNFSFSNIVQGIYTIFENLEIGWTSIGLTSLNITLNPGDPSTGNDFTNFQNGFIQGIKFNDLNGNGQIDEDESGLEEWTIFIDTNEDGLFDDGEEQSTTTDSDGNYSFTNLEPDSYTVCEQEQAGWQRTKPAESNCETVQITDSGQTSTVDFGNQGQGTITVHKNVDNNGDGQVDEENVTNWTWDINQEGDFATGDNSQGVAAGSYTISEDQQESYHVSALECNNNGSYDPSESIEVTVDAGQNLICTFTNTRNTGSVTILKNLDNNGDGDTKDEGETGVTDWTWDITDNDQNIPTGQTKILPTGTYTISEDQKDGYKLLGWTCSNEQTGTTNSIEINVTNSSGTTCTFTNQILPPVLSLTKTNDRLGIDVSAGANVLYTLTVTLTGSPLSNVSLTDLPPAGFKYRSGSWTANSNTRGNLSLGPTTEPTYASPGTWNLGDMASGEVVTLTYIADIESSQDPGLYKDLAWSKGTGASGAVLANQSTGFFVGTEVNVVKNISDSTGVEVIKKEQGEILGASIALPATGANASWLIFAAFLLVGGAGMVFKGVSLRRKYE